MAKASTLQKDAEILSAFEEVDTEFKDHSTMFVIQMTADRAGVDYGRVVDALSRDAKKREKEKNGPQAS